MKFNGRQIKGPRQKIVPIIRDEGNLCFVVKGVTSFEAFTALCPLPKAPRMKLPGDRYKDDVENPVYRQQLDEWFKQKSAWTFITAIRDTPGFEWETVDYSKPETWSGFIKELEESGFSDSEQIMLLNAVSEVNGLNEELIEEARRSFLTLQELHPNGSSSPKADQSITPPGKPASSSESSPQDLKESNPSTS